MMISILALAFMTGSAHQSSAPTAATPPARPRRVCRVKEELGTILPRRVCRSAEEWAAIDEAQARITDRDAAHVQGHGRTSMYDPAQPLPR